MTNASSCQTVAGVVKGKLVSFIDDTGLLLVVCRCNDPLENVGSLLGFSAALVNSVFILSMRRSKPKGQTLSPKLKARHR